MKIFYNLIIVFIFLSVTACEKFRSDTSLTGKWKLTETLADPGDGSGKWVSVKNSDSYLQINADGTLSSNNFINYKQYRVIDDQKIEFIYQNGMTTILNYKLNGNSLEIKGGCIEACGSRYKK